MTFNRYLLAPATLALGLTMAAPAHAAPEPFIGQIVPTTNTYCPRNFVQASGQLLSISSNTALFSLLGTTFGGDGTSTFALPNLDGRMPIGVGQGGGLPNVELGQVAGSPTIQLTQDNLPAHTHTAKVRASNTAGNSNQPVRNSFAGAPAGMTIYSNATPTVSMRAGNINLQPAGRGNAIAHTMPALVVRYCIALAGIFPSRD
jgi:microcystin-dependent protein